MFELFKTRKAGKNGDRAATEATLEKSRDQVFRALIENASDVITILSATGIIEYESPSVKRVLGFSPEELVGRSAFDFVHPDDLGGVVAKFREVIATGAEGQGMEFRFLHKDGSWRYLELTGTNLLEDKLVEGIVVNSRDLTDRRRAEQSLRESEERYALAVQGANDGLWDWNLEKEQIYLSPRWKSMLGLSHHEVGDRPEEWLDRTHPEDREHLQLALAAHLEGRTPHFESEYRIRHQDGEYRYMLCRGLAVRSMNGRAQRIAGSQSDITDRKRAEQQLIYDALHDGLTRLPNRALFLDRLRGAVARANRRKGYLFAVMFLDLDRFKIINDSLGHSIGDQLLVEVSRVLEKSVRPEDTVARLGGDEFIILIDDLQDREQAISIARRVHDLLIIPFTVKGHEVFSTASIGITFNSPDCELPEDYIRDSDIAMYRAKALGKARSETFDTSMRARAMHLLELETDLRRAVERKEIEVWYQPIVDIQSKRITGFEGLARWKSPTRGMVMPADFIPIAEETGLIVPIGLSVLRASCKQLRYWQHEMGASELTLSVNLSIRQFTEPNLVEQIKEILAANSLQPSHLRLEITESVVIGDLDATKRIMGRIRDLGIKVCLDDFGTGYSSLSYLIRLPIDTLKIDRSFVRGIESGHEHSDVVDTIIRLAKNLDLNVVAEGVETNEQLSQLSALRCDQAQGYLFSKPVEPQIATEMLKTFIFPANPAATMPADKRPVQCDTAPFAPGRRAL